MAPSIQIPLEKIKEYMELLEQIIEPLISIFSLFNLLLSRRGDQKTKPVRDVVNDYVEEIVTQTPYDRKPTREDAMKQLEKLQNEGIYIKIFSPQKTSIRIKYRKKGAWEGKPEIELVQFGIEIEKQIRRTAE